MDAPIVQHLSAITLAVADLDRSVRFYEAAGFLVTYRSADFATFAVAGSYLNLTAIDGPPPGPGWGRAIFYVDDVDRQHARLIAAGIAPEMAPADATWGERYFHVRDPDGHEISFARPL